MFSRAIITIVAAAVDADDVRWQA